MAYPVTNSTTWLFISQGRAREQLIWGAAGAGLIMLSVLAGLPWGALGVARSSGVVTCLVQVPLMCWAVTRDGPIRMCDYARACYPFGPRWARIGGGYFSAGHSHRRASDPAGARGLRGPVLCRACCGVGRLPHGKVVLRDIWGLRGSFGRTVA